MVNGEWGRLQWQMLFGARKPLWNKCSIFNAQCSIFRDVPIEDHLKIDSWALNIEYFPKDSVLP
jgi:hypothetical protein